MFFLAGETIMLANRLLNPILTLLALVLLPVQLLTTALLGLLVTLTFGLLLLPISAVWVVLLFPLLGASRVCSKVPPLRSLVGLLLLPLAVVANSYAALMPSMGELESRAIKLLLTSAWPFSWELWQFSRGRLDLNAPEAEQLVEVLRRVVEPRDALTHSVIATLQARE